MQIYLDELVSKADDRGTVKSANFISLFSSQNQNQGLLLNLWPIKSTDFIIRVSNIL